MAKVQTIDTREQMPQNFSLDDLRVLHYSGRSKRLPGSGRDAKYEYRHGIVCPLGDIEKSLWSRLAMEQIEAEGSTNMYAKLVEWQKNNCAWLRTKKEVEQYALECFSGRLYQNPQWVDYEAFHAQGR